MSLDYDYFDEYEYATPYRKSVCEYVSDDGKIIRYDACSSKSLEESIKAYKKIFKYIGSNNGKMIINGVENNFNEPHHFFIRKNKVDLRKDKLNEIRKNKLNEINEKENIVE